jgi:hypothetical protein
MPNMSFKGLVLKVSAFLLVGPVAVASAALIAYKRPTASQQERLIPVNVTQLPLESGAFPVEMRCEAALSPALNKLDEFSCLVINNTRKKISALAVVYSVVVDDGDGETEQGTNLLTTDFAIHPDVIEIKRQKLFSPGESSRVGPPGPVAFESGVVVRVEIHIDYVEFEDKTSMGPNTYGSKAIGSIHEGAAKYKAWLVQQYKRSGMDEQSVAALLDDADLPKELNFNGDPDLSQGARAYRSILRSVYNPKGGAELRRYLNK